MRKIRSKEEIEKKQKKNQIILGVIMIVLLVGSVAGFSIMSQNNENQLSIKESGTEFFKENGFWKTSFGGDIFAFQNLPSEVSNITVNITTALGDYSKQPLYLINTDNGASEILMNIERYILRYQEACLVNSTCTGNLPTKDCLSNLIIFESGNKTEVYSKNKCVYIVGDSIKAADAFLYKILGIQQ